MSRHGFLDAPLATRGTAALARMTFDGMTANQVVADQRARQK